MIPSHYQSHLVRPRGGGGSIGARALRNPGRRLSRSIVGGMVLSVLCFGACQLMAEEALIAIQAEGETAGKALLTHDSVTVPQEGLQRAPDLRSARGKTFNTGGFSPEAVSLEMAVTMEQFIELPFEVAPGIEVEALALDIAYDISETGPRGIEVRVSADGFETHQVLLTDDSVDPKGEKYMDEPLETPARLRGDRCALRIYAWGAASTRGTLDFEDMGANVSLALRGNVLSSAVD